MFNIKLSPVKAPSYSGYKNTGWLPQRMALLEPKAAASFTRLMVAAKGCLHFTDVYRSVTTQIEAIRTASAAKRRLYAPPTKSGHNFGMSFDVAIDESLVLLSRSDDSVLREAGKSRDAMAEWLRDHEWHGISTEQWHFDFLDGHVLVVDRIDEFYGKCFTLSDLEVQRAVNELKIPSVPILVEDGVLGRQSLAAVSQARAYLGLDSGGADAWFRRVLAGATATAELVPAP